MSENIKKNLAVSDDYRPLGGPVGEAQSGTRLDAYLSTHFPFYSRATWQRKINSGAVLVDGKCFKVSAKVQEGQRIKILHLQEKEPEVDRGIEPLWKKGSVMAVYKPGNLPMHENGPYRKNTFAHLLTTEFGDEWAAVHRLDKETSGIVLCGSTHDVREELARSLAQRSLGKEYIAIVKGQCTQDSWYCDGPIDDLKDSKIRIKKWVVAGGPEAETDFICEERKEAFSLIRAFPKTGRTNQIRIHAAYSGYPLVGDITYHPDEEVFLEWFSSGKTDWVRKEAGFDRCLLHATAVTFEHPETREFCQIRCPMPEDMEGFWRSL